MQLEKSMLFLPFHIYGCLFYFFRCESFATIILLNRGSAVYYDNNEQINLLIIQAQAFQQLISILSFSRSHYLHSNVPAQTNVEAECCESLSCPSWEWSHPRSCCVLPIKAGSHCLSSGLAALRSAAPARPRGDIRPHTDGLASKHSCVWLEPAPVGVAEWTRRSAHRLPRVLGVGSADRAQMLR